MDPVTIFGAVAGCVQLLDASIKTSKKCRSLISTFRHAEESIEHLDRAMNEAEGLMIDLQTFAMAAQQIPPDQLNQYGHVLTSSLGQIAWNYSNDLKCLANLLPSPSSINLKERFSFCRDQKAINNIILRLEQRKTAATLALGVLGRVEDLKKHAISLELEKSMRELSLEQSRLSEELARSMIAGTEQGRKTASTLLQIQKDVELYSTELQTSLASMETIVTTRYSQLATKSQITTIAASSVDQLGKIVRLELKRQLEPLRSRLDITDKMIDELATEVATHSRDQGIFESQKPEQGTHKHSPDQSLENVSFGSSGHSHILMGNPKVPPSRRKVIMFTYACSRYIEFGTLSIAITTYRTKTSSIQPSQTYFRLKIGFTPCPWLFSRGLSLLYSSEPSTDGYFNICPRLRIFGVYCNGSPIEKMLQQDDVISFQRALETHEFGIWDVDDMGGNHLERAVYSNSTGISQYLLSTEYAETLLNDGDLHLGICVQELLPWIPDLEIGHQFLSSIINFFGPNDQGDLSKHFCIWDRLWGRKRSLPYFHGLHEHTQSLEARQCVTLSTEYGIFLQPEHFLGHPWCQFSFEQCSDRIQYLMALFLTTGGNPNHKFENGYPLLVEIFRQIRICIFRHFSHIIDFNSSNGEEEIDNDDSEDSADSSDSGSDCSDGSSHYSDCIGPDADDDDICYWCCKDKVERFFTTLLVTVIKSGADIHWFWTDDSISGHHHTLFTIAEDLHALGIWQASLKQCGYLPNEVYKETLSRMKRVDQLGGSTHSNVDVPSIIETPVVTGVRLRRNPGPFNDA